MQNQTTAVWDVLASKAKAEVRQAQSRFDNARAREEGRRLSGEGKMNFVSLVGHGTLGDERLGRGNRREAFDRLDTPGPGIPGGSGRDPRGQVWVEVGFSLGALGGWPTGRHCAERAPAQRNLQLPRAAGAK